MMAAQRTAALFNSSSGVKGHEEYYQTFQPVRILTSQYAGMICCSKSPQKAAGHAVFCSCCPSLQREPLPLSKQVLDACQSISSSYAK